MRTAINRPLSVEAEYSQTVSIQHREKYAQFFTPYPIAELMVKWLLGNEELHHVLEPAFGLGIFSRILLRNKEAVKITGFEIDSVIYNKATKEYNNTDRVSLFCRDYMFHDWDNDYDGIICNPPYFKFHDFDNKNILKEIEKRLNIKLNGFTNLYTIFLIKSIHQLKPNGRCAYIVPSEFMNSNYGVYIKDILLKSGKLRHIIVIDFEENVFDDALTTASIILCANDTHSESVKFTKIKSLKDIDVVDNIISKYPNSLNNTMSYRRTELDQNIKWKNYYQPQTDKNMFNLVPFSKYAKAMRGIATGANEYFIFNKSKAKKYEIDEKYLLPCICHAVDIQGNYFSKYNFEMLKNNDKNVYLLNAANTNDKNVLKYIQKGENENIHKKYLTSNRLPWYAVEKRQPAPILFPIFNRKGLKFIWNDTDCLNLTAFHCIYPNVSILSNISIELLFAYLLTDTARSIFEQNAREYGNGLQKFEPNDLNKAEMLDLNLLSPKNKNEILCLYSNYVTTSEQKYLYEIDNILKQYLCTEISNRSLYGNNLF